MLGFFVSWLISTVAILVAAYLIPGIKVDSVGAALVGAAILGVLNALVRPVFVILTLPVTILTLGLFLFVINALLFLLAGSMVSGFQVRSFGSAFLGSLVVSVVTYLAHVAGM
ncbi:MAG: phage holin family protein [Deltaproteobacteria bacterium]|nr:phage holin family protein [Deltaproteobacteria bacterium]